MFAIVGNAIGVVGLTCLMLVLVWPEKTYHPKRRDEDPDLGDYKSITWRD